MVYTEAQKELTKIGEGMVVQIQNAIKGSNKYNTGNLYNSVRVKMGLGGMTIIIAAPYAKFVLAGRRAGSRMPPIKAILSWFKGQTGSKVLSKMMTKKGMKPITAAAMIANSIKKKGIKPMKKSLTVDAIFSKMKTKAFKELEEA